MIRDLLKIEPHIEEILSRSVNGRRMSREEAIELANSNGANLLALGLAADRIRKNRAGEVVTYIVNRNINFTNVCIGSCEFCAFRRSKDSADAYLLGAAQFRKKVEDAQEAAAAEVCVQGGLHPDLDIEHYVAMLKVIKNAGMHAHAFSPMEVSYMAEKSGMSVRDALKYLKESGLDSMPGTAAEILDDRVRGKICPKKLKTEEWVGVVKEAHKLGIPTTATMLYGHVESAEEQVEHLAILRKLQDETKLFTEFIPLSFVHYNSPLYASGKVKGGATGVEDIRVHALARIFLDNFTNIQASWVKLGRKLAQVMLSFGANDLGGTLMEENISKSAGINVEIPSVRELERMILDAGRIPRQRNTLYAYQT